MPLVKDKEFTDEPVDIDDTQFFKCQFLRCTFVYSGGGAPSFEQCKFGEIRFEFAGPAARTISLINDLYNTPFRPVVDATFERIISGLPIARTDNNAIQTNR